MSDTKSDTQLSLERLKPLLELGDLWVWEIDNEGTFTYLDAHTKNFIGYEAQELLGKSIFDLMPRLEQDRLLPLYRKSITEKTNIVSQLNVKLHKQGYYLYLTTNAYPFYDEDGKLMGYRGVDYNINKEIDLEHKLNQQQIIRKQRENELSLAHNELIEKAKKEAFKYNVAFFSNMSKEISKPIGEIIKIAYKAFDGEIDPIKRRYLEKIEVSAKILGEMIDDILDLSKIEIDELSITKEPFDLLKTLDEMMHLLDIYAQSRGITIDISYGKELKRYYLGDALRIRQLLTNLISSMMSFAQSKSIEFFIDCHEGCNLYFEVKDSTLVLSQKQIDKLYKPFNEIDNLMSLSFTLSDALALRMNGKVWVESSDEEGSCFNVEIGLEEADVMESVESNKEILEDLKNSLRTLNGSTILLVEDYFINHQMVYNYLQKSEIFIESAKNSKDALRMYGDKPNHFELIFVDIDMAHGEGIKTIEEFKEMGCNAPIIALREGSSTIDTNVNHIALIDEYLDKPIDAVKFYKILLKHIFPKAMVSTKINRDVHDIKFPAFESIDTAIGLANSNHNKTFYIETLHNFRAEYYGMYLEALDDTELEEITAALKIHSKDIGALKLHYTVANYETYHSQEYLSKLYNELHNVIEEIEEKLVE
ncbi:MAG: PAS domain S-box protein [Campylobacterales bacterium]|nr:PAS domain S-box protein [Campylobacterales bacterium]